MFEQMKIGSSINLILRVRGVANGLRASKIEKIIRPLLPDYAVLMRQEGLTADQTAVALITETISKIDLGDFGLLSTDQPDVVMQLAVLYDSCKRMCMARPDTFSAYFQPADPTVAAILDLKIR